MPPAISIIIPVYNAEKYIAKCLDALLVQTFDNIEVICVNDGSKDNSLDILRDYERRDSRIKVFSQTNSGPAKARNVGLQNAHGDYLMFCDSDDWYEPDMCRIMKETIEREKVDFVMCDCNIIDSGQNHGRSRGMMNYIHARGEGIIELTQDNRDKCNVVLWNKIFKRSIVETHSISFPDGYEHDDDAFIWQYIIFAERYCVIKDRLYNYLILENSIMGTLFNRKRAKVRFDRYFVLEHVFNVVKRQGVFEKNQLFLQKCFQTTLLASWRFFETEDEKDKALEFARGLLENFEDEFKVSFEVGRFLFERKNDELKEYLDNLFGVHVSVILMTRRGDATLSSTLDALLSQSCISNIEIIALVETDDITSFEKLKDAKRGYPQLQIIESVGAYNIDKVIDCVKGEYISIIESGDVPDAQFYRSLYRNVKNNSFLISKGRIRRPLADETYEFSEFNTVLSKANGDKKRLLLSFSDEMKSAIFSADLLRKSSTLCESDNTPLGDGELFLLRLLLNEDVLKIGIVNNAGMVCQSVNYRRNPIERVERCMEIQTDLLLSYNDRELVEGILPSFFESRIHRLLKFEIEDCLSLSDICDSLHGIQNALHMWENSGMPYRPGMYARALSGYPDDVERFYMNRLNWFFWEKQEEENKRLVSSLEKETRVRLKLEERLILEEKKNKERQARNDQQIAKLRKENEVVTRELFLVMSMRQLLLHYRLLQLRYAFALGKKRQALKLALSEMKSLVREGRYIKKKYSRMIY